VTNPRGNGSQSAKGARSAERAFMASCRALPVRHRTAFQDYVELVRNRKPNEVVVLADLAPTGEPLAVAYDPSRRILPDHVVGALASLQPKTPGEEMREQFEAIRNRILDEALPTRDVSRRLRITGEAIRKRLERKELFGLKVGRDYRFPEWQFDARSSSGVLPGLCDVLKAIGLAPIEIAGWFERRMTELDDRSPIEALRAGDIDAVVDAAKAAGVT
jgi:hypothetical protein